MEIHNLKLQLMFLNLIDKLTTLMCEAKMATLAGDLMASVVDQVLLKFIKQLRNKPDPFIFKIYLLPFVTWFDYAILKELVKSSKSQEAIELVDQFDSCIDYDQPITSCIPEFSHLIIPWKENDNEYILLVTKHCKKRHNERVLRELLKIKTDLTSQWGISSHVFHLVAMCSKLNYFYWMIPTKLCPSLEEMINQDKQVLLWERGIISVAILTHNYLSDQISQQSIGYKFEVLCFNIMDDATEVLMYMHTYVTTVHAYSMFIVI